MADGLTADEQLVAASLAYHYQEAPGLLSVCSDADRWVGRRFPTGPAGIAAAVQYVRHLDRQRPKGIYAQVTTLREQPVKGRGGKDLAHAVTLLWADGDFGTAGHKPGLDDMPHPIDAQHVRQIVSAAGLPEPSGWWLSGGGCNPVWQLDEPRLIGDDADRTAVEQITMGLQAILGACAYGHGCGWDTQVGNLDRLMRIPGTVNRKGGDERATSSLAGSGQAVTFEAMRDAVSRLEPDARRILEKAAQEKRARQDERTGRERRPVPLPRQAAGFPAFSAGTGVFDILAAGLTFRDVLEPAGWTYRGTAGDGRDKWLRPAGAEGSADSDYSLICDDHVAVNWSERSGLPVGTQATGHKLTVPTLWAHLYYNGDERAAALDVLHAAFGHNSGRAALKLPAAVLTEVQRRCRPPRPPRPEGALPAAPPDDICWPELDGEPEPDPEDDPPGGQADSPAGGPAFPGLLPESFYAARPELQHIRQAGHSRNRSGDVAFLSTLTRLSGMVSHRIRADTGVAGFASLNLFGGIIGPSGVGKSTGVEVADRLMPTPAWLDFRDGLPIGSGEGMAEVFMGTVEEPTGDIHRGGLNKGDPVMTTVRKQVRHNAFFYVDEGKTLTRLMKERSGSTLGETLRSAAVGQTLGQTNASKDTSRYIPSGSYSMGLLVGFQPETAAPLFEEIAEGTPQRFLWAQVIDPSIPDKQPSWPGELTEWRRAIQADDTAQGLTLVSFDQQIKDELRRADLAKARGETPVGETNALDSHAPLMRVKVASLLAILAGRHHVDRADWDLSLVVWEASCAARDAVLEYGERQRRLEAAKRTEARIIEEVRVEEAKVSAEADRADKAVERVATRLAVLVAESGPTSRKAVRDRFAGRDKKHMADAISYALLREWIVLNEADRGLAPGPVPPG